ncbi:type 2 DNA topoisomerase 6 subunit B-like [Ziziphus jujuba]|uniref:Type 2 DNA topoisomerase 6 subunit B-like n=1 Tax=Ziziphus jujuba TaxID=326968 RepID=A0ABM3ZYV5_ZIZJJ|nr:type 2 DNA topoisomerase 6 subunit B-like [Ziziphus jujuba]
MNFASARELCLYLISSAFQRCRLSDDLCRLSVILKQSSPASDHPVVQISISDTGIGSCLDDFRTLKFSGESVGNDEQWDGVISVTNTSVSDNEIYHYQLNLKERDSARRLTMLPSNSKNGVKFSGTEVCLSIFISINVLRGEINRFFQKILILKIPSVAIELVTEYGSLLGSKVENLFLANSFNPLPFSASNLERLKSGLEDYVLKHGNVLNKQCDLCFQSLENLKIGSGTASHAERNGNGGLVMEVVIILSEISERTSTCFTSCSARTEVLYFRDFSTCSISQSSLKALTSIDWRSYGLTLESVKDQGGYVEIEWENLPPHTRIDIVLHAYPKQYPTVIIPSRRPKVQTDGNLIKKAVKLALDDLRNKHAGVLLSAHSLKIRSYAPDLAKTISGLILCSNDPDFQHECFSLLGLQSQGVESEIVEASIKEKLLVVIDMNNRKPQKSKEVAPFLFEDDHFNEPGFQDEECEGEDAFSATPMDI